MNTITRRLSLFSGVNAQPGAPLLILMILGMMVLPLPAFLLDIMFTFNIALSVMVLLSIHTLKPLDFAVFPPCSCSRRSSGCRSMSPRPGLCSWKATPAPTRRGR